MSIKTVSSRIVYSNNWMRLREDAIERGDGQPGIYAVVDKDPASIVIPLEVTPDGEFLYLVEQFRYTIGGRYMEFPQGGWESADVDPEELARGELREELGIVAEKMTHLADLQIAYGQMNQLHHTFLAEGLTHGEPDPDAEEDDLVVRRYSVTDFETMLLDGTIVDNCTAAAWGVYLVWKKRQLSTK